MFGAVVNCENDFSDESKWGQKIDESSYRKTVTQFTPKTWKEKISVKAEQTRDVWGRVKKSWWQIWRTHTRGWAREGQTRWRFTSGLREKSQPWAIATHSLVPGAQEKQQRVNHVTETVVTLLTRPHKFICHLSYRGKQMFWLVVPIFFGKIMLELSTGALKFAAR